MSEHLTSDPLRTFYHSIFAASAACAAAAPVAIGLAGGVPMFPFMVGLTVVITGVLQLNVGLVFSIKLLLILTHILMARPGTVSPPSSAQVFIVIGTLLTLFLGDVNVVLSASDLGVGEIGDGKRWDVVFFGHQKRLDSDVVSRRC